eukprot:TRINITY_DN316_c0_g2_i1.p1 TRINITY_DN316_c0_g2~~TRINITY_DN316_c0_g2_i1.p1  ORF type:complete len:1087 (+),score=196.25 TRINITY_DN316_c0_g2_i1:158-3418(+)
MGVPSFFRWLSQKYPQIVIDVIEDKAVCINGVEIPLDTSKTNPNNIEFDNLYLDMNGIIHPCTHPEDGSEPSTEEEMIERIMSYVDRLFAIVRPRRLLFLAIDGVAPRAKMNQQRSRRFRTAKEAKEKREKDLDLRTDMISRGVTDDLPEVDKPHFDSNCITPGTLFMEKVAKGLIYYVHDRQTNDPGWKNIKVLISDSNVPGEGEHKIMELIRHQRTQPDYDPNQRHVICGLDADLIMLGLATHEPHFYLLRENVFSKTNNSNCFKCGQPGHRAHECTRKAAEKPKWNEQPFQFLTISVLREYLRRDLRISVPFGYDFERVIDDFVFLCFFVGNDFIPHLPTLEIREGAIDLLLGIYRNILPSLGDYLTKDGEVNLGNVEKLLRELSPLEDSILQKRRQRERQQNKRDRDRKRREDRNAGYVHEQLAISAETIAAAEAMTRTAQSIEDSPQANRVRAEIARSAMSFPQHSSFSQGNGANGVIGTNNEDEDEDDKSDYVKLGESGWHERYYQSKFGSSTDMVLRHRIVSSYVEGLCWVMRYYYQGCCSWNWFFPFHFAPFANDLTEIHNVVLDFDKGRPFKPLTQLMGVLPPASASLLPQSYRELMTDENSPIIDYYPEEFEVDMNGKKMAWLGVVLLPFMDEQRLVNAIEPLEATLTAEEYSRNTFRTDGLFVNGRVNPMTQLLISVYRSQDQSVTLELSSVPMKTCDRLFGRIGKLRSFPSFQLGETVPSPVPTLPPVAGNECLSAAFYSVELPPNYIFKSGLLDGVEFDEPTLPEEAEGEHQRRIVVESAARMIKAGVNAEYEPRGGFNRRNSDYNNNRGPRSDYGNDRRRSFDNNDRGGGYYNQQYNDRANKRPRMSDPGHGIPNDRHSRGGPRNNNWRGDSGSYQSEPNQRGHQQYQQDKPQAFDSFNYSGPLSKNFSNQNPFNQTTTYPGPSSSTSGAPTTHTLQLLQQLQAQLHQEQSNLQRNQLTSQTVHTNQNLRSTNQSFPPHNEDRKQYQQQYQQYQNSTQNNYGDSFQNRGQYQAHQSSSYQAQNQNQYQSSVLQTQQTQTQYQPGPRDSEQMRSNPNSVKRPYPQQQQQSRKH